MAKTPSPKPMGPGGRPTRRRRELYLRRVLEMIRPHAASEPLFADICTEMAERLGDECFHQLALEFSLLAEEALLRQPDIPPSRLRRARWMVADFREVLGRER